MDSDNEVVFYASPKWIMRGRTKMMGCPGLLINNHDLTLNNSKLLNSALKVSSQSLNEIYGNYIYKLNHSFVNYLNSMDKITNRISKDILDLETREKALEGINEYWREKEYNIQDWRKSSRRDLEWISRDGGLISGIKELSWYPYFVINTIIPELIHLGISTVKVGVHELLYVWPMQFIRGGGPALSANNHHNKNLRLAKSPLATEFHPIYFKDKISDTLNNIPYMRYIHNGSNFESLKFPQLNSLPPVIEEFAVINYSVKNDYNSNSMIRDSHYGKLHSSTSSLIYDLVHWGSNFRIPDTPSLKHSLPIQFNMKYYKKTGQNAWKVYELQKLKKSEQASKFINPKHFIEYNLTNIYNIENVLKINEFGYIIKIIEDSDVAYKFKPHFTNTLDYSYNHKYDAHQGEIFFAEYDEIDNIFFKGDINNRGNYLWGNINANSFNTIMWEDNIYPINYPRSLSIPNYK
jgi:hypothetical protein